jgi:hypothetical protein
MFNSSTESPFGRDGAASEFHHGAVGLDAGVLAADADAEVAAGATWGDEAPTFMAKVLRLTPNQQQSLRYGKEHEQRRHALENDPNIAILTVA